MSDEQELNCRKSLRISIWSEKKNLRISIILWNCWDSYRSEHPSLFSEYPSQIYIYLRPGFTSPILDPRFSILDSRSSILDPRFSILDSRSSILDSYIYNINMYEYIYMYYQQKKTTWNCWDFWALNNFRDRGSSITSRRKLSQATTSQMLSDFQSDCTKVRPPKQSIGKP